MHLVALSLNESKAGVDLVLIETSLCFSYCINDAVLMLIGRKLQFYQNEVINSNLKMVDSLRYGS